MENYFVALLETGGDKIILCCDFDVKKLPVNLPVFYRECFECFTQCSAVARKSEIEQYQPKKYPTPLYGVTNSFALMVNQYSIQD